MTMTRRGRNWRELEEGYGLSRRAIKLLGFDQPCQCGHEEGLHNEFGECAVLECNCLKFAADGEEQSR